MDTIFGHIYSAQKSPFWIKHMRLQLWITIVTLFGCCHGHFNLFMNETETRRMLGIEGELYYVRNNLINDYALTFNVPIKPETEHLYFNWQHVPIPKSPVPKMRYNASITVSNEAAMKIPVISIPPRGLVPTNVKVFRVTLQCTYLSTAEINVVIMLNVTMFNLTHPTSLQIRRKKTCIRDDKRAQDGDGSGGNDVDIPDDDLDQAKRKSMFSTTSTKFFYIAISAACLVILLIAVVVIIWYLRVHKQSNERLSDTSSSTLTPKSQYTKVDTPNTSVVGMTVGPPQMMMPTQPLHLPVYHTQAYPSHPNHQIMAAAGGGGSSNGGSLVGSGVGNGLMGPPPMIMAGQPGPGSGVGMNAMAPPAMRRPLSPLNELCPEDIDNIIHEIQIDRKKLSLGEILMEGTFGKIYRGTMLIEMDIEKSPRTTEMDVFVKTVTDAASPGQIDTMLREGCALTGQIHNNINPILATCLEHLQPPMLIYQFLNEGNLKKFLQRSKIGELSSHQSLNTQQLVYMATQLCRGVQFLHRKRIIHRDIATRNCIVDSNLIVRVSDRGLSRDLFSSDYHCLGDNENRPIKWMSIEALLDRKYSYASDVWSFGVTLWEILSLGQQPYADVDPFEMAAYLREGYRVSQPLNCPDELFAVMACCWALNPDERPTMAQLQVCMQDFYTALGRFI